MDGLIHLKDYSFIYISRCEIESDQIKYEKLNYLWYEHMDSCDASYEENESKFELRKAEEICQKSEL